MKRTRLYFESSGSWYLRGYVYTSCNRLEIPLEFDPDRFEVVLTKVARNRDYGRCATIGAILRCHKMNVWLKSVSHTECDDVDIKLRNFFRRTGWLHDALLCLIDYGMLSWYDYCKAKGIFSRSVNASRA